MLWCLMSMAMMAALLGLAALTAHPLRALARVRPGPSVRGCLALFCLLVAFGLGVVAWIVAR